MKIYAKILLFVSLCLLCMGCTLTLKNQTSKTFPWLLSELSVVDFPDLFMYDATYNRLMLINDDPKHTFNLEVKPQNVTNIRCFVTVNGIEHEMQIDPHFSRLYTWTPDTPFGEPVEYYFRARYKRGGYGYATKYVGSATEPFRVEPVGYGYAVIIVPNQKAIPFDNMANLVPKVSFYLIEDKDIIVQSLHPNQVRVQQVELIDLPDNNNQYFELIDVPSRALELAGISTNGHPLNFGEQFRFKVEMAPGGSNFVTTNGYAVCFISMIIYDGSEGRCEHLQVGVVSGGI